MAPSFVTQQQQHEQCRQFHLKRSRMKDVELEGNGQQNKSRKSTSQQAPTLLESTASTLPFDGNKSNKKVSSIFCSVNPSKPFDLLCPNKYAQNHKLLSQANHKLYQPSQQFSKGLKLYPRKSNQLDQDMRNQFTLTTLRWRVQNMFHQTHTYPDVGSQDPIETSSATFEEQETQQCSVKQKVLSDSTAKNDHTMHDRNVCERNHQQCIHCVSTTSSLLDHRVNESPPTNHLRRRRTSILKDFDSEELYSHHHDTEDTAIIPAIYCQTLLTEENDLMSKLRYEKHNLVDLDYLGYGHFWYIHHRQREHAFQPWQLTLSGKMEKLRLSVTSMYWESMKYHAISLPTIYVAINNFNRLLSSWPSTELEHPSPSQWALTAVVAYRLAFKLEERPEILWEVNSFWDMFPMFTEWSIDRSDGNMNRVEMAALDTLHDTMDIPLAPMFLNSYLMVGGWPQDVIKEYRDLAMYILGVVTFASVKDVLLRNVVPSVVAIAALILAIKIVNGDRNLPCGILHHLKNCPRSSHNAWKDGSSPMPECICRYEFYPDRLRTYCNMQLNEILPVIRGLSNLLRAKPDETSALKYSFPLWGEHDWR